MNNRGCCTAFVTLMESHIMNSSYDNPIKWGTWPKNGQLTTLGTLIVIKSGCWLSPTPLKNMKVNWDDYSTCMEEWKMFQTTNQCLCNNPYYDLISSTIQIFWAIDFWTKSKLLLGGSDSERWWQVHLGDNSLQHPTMSADVGWWGRYTCYKH